MFPTLTVSNELQWLSLRQEPDKVVPVFAASVSCPITMDTSEKCRLNKLQYYRTRYIITHSREWKVTQSLVVSLPYTTSNAQSAMDSPVKGQYLEVFMCIWC